jgi:two-component system sensor histidine kinase AlgZ
MAKNPSQRPQGQDASQSEPGFLPDFCNARVIFLVILGAILLAFVLSLSSLQHGEDYWVNLSMIALFIVWIAFGNILILCLSRKFLNGLQPIVAAFSCYGLSLLVTVVISILAVVTTPQETTLLSTNDSLFMNGFLLRNIAISAIVSAVALRYFYVQHQWKSNIQSEARSRIQALQARIRPHFLFNSMNTIASLTQTDPIKAEKAVLDLADLFRASLGHQDKVTLREELDFTKLYINIEELRLGDRLKIELHLQDSLSLSTLIPALILQPLVENAIYHGVEPLTEGGTVKIEIESTAKELQLTITNPRPVERDPLRSGNKMAQDNIRQRLQLAYGDQSKMKIKESDDNYSVSFHIPIEAK